MVTNQGQAQLFWNFVCVARARSVDLSHLLLFASDVETHELAQTLGMLTFFDESVRLWGSACWSSLCANDRAPRVFDFAPSTPLQ